MKKIMTVIGARPQFIKAAPFSYKLKEDFSNDFSELIVHTGQHYDENMSAIFFEELGIPSPDINLDIGSYTHGKQTGSMLIELERIMIGEKPDAVVVYGDTNSTLAGALAASKLLIPVVHIEAGLRSFNMKMPEEKNRIITDHISDLLFCPTKKAIDNLKDESVKGKVFLTGDIMYDSFLFFSKQNISDIRKEEDFILFTMHRPENTDNPERIRNIIDIINKIDKNIIFPIHPRTKKILKKMDVYLSDKIKIIDPVGYLEMISLLNNASLVMTDSGGLQKEAAFAEKPCITLRDDTEWEETVNNKWNIICSDNSERVFEAMDFFSKNKPDFSSMEEIFGDGNSSGKMISTIKEHLSNTGTT